MFLYDVKPFVLTAPGRDRRHALGLATWIDDFGTPAELLQALRSGVIRRRAVNPLRWLTGFSGPGRRRGSDRENLDRVAHGESAPPRRRRCRAHRAVRRATAGMSQRRGDAAGPSPQAHCRRRVPSRCRGTSRRAQSDAGAKRLKERLTPHCDSPQRVRVGSVRRSARSYPPNKVTLIGYLVRQCL